MIWTFMPITFLECYKSLSLKAKENVYSFRREAANFLAFFKTLLRKPLKTLFKRLNPNVRIVECKEKIPKIFASGGIDMAVYTDFFLCQTSQSVTLNTNIYTSPPNRYGY